MDKGIFTTSAPGRLWEISVKGSKDWAFIPDPLPDEWEVSTDLWSLLVQAREELARLDGVGRYMPNYNLLLRPLQRREALRSSSLEGTYATPQQLLLFEIEPREPKSANDPVNFWQEVWNYNRALELALSLLEQRPLNLNLIRAMHQTLPCKMTQNRNASRCNVDPIRLGSRSNIYDSDSRSVLTTQLHIQCH
jgi:Fic family protein